MEPRLRAQPVWGIDAHAIYELVPEREAHGEFLRRLLEAAETERILAAAALDTAASAQSNDGTVGRRSQ